LPFKERRRAKRYNVELPLVVRWTEGSKQREAHTVTHDISSGGVYFFLPGGISEGTAVEVEMTVPTQITRGAPTKVLCQGRVRRCELKATETAGMGTAIEKYEFLAGTEDAA
jgi:c-di-GMP-binding flagellar brake protein YcgR